MPFIPIMATTLMAKAIIKPISRLQNVRGALSDPLGWHAAHLQAANIGVYVGMWQYNLDDYAHYIASGIVALGFFITVLLIVRMPSEKKRAATFLLILLALAFASITFSAMVGSALEPNNLLVPPWDPC